MAKMLIIATIISVILVICPVLKSDSPQCIFSRDPIMCVELSKVRGN